MSVTESRRCPHCRGRLQKMDKAELYYEHKTEQCIKHLAAEVAHMRQMMMRGDKP